MESQKIVLSEKLLGQKDSIFSDFKLFEFADVRQIQLPDNHSSFLNLTIKKVIIHSNNEHFITSFTFPVLMNLDQPFFEQLTKVYGKPDGMFKKGKPSNTTTNEDDWKTQTIEYQTVEVSLKENPEFIFWNKDTYQLQVRPFPEKKVWVFYFSRNNH